MPSAIRTSLVVREYAFSRRWFNRTALFSSVIGVLMPGMAMAEPLRLLAFGDSLTAGYGLSQDTGFVPVLEARLQEEGIDVTVENAGVSGDTTAGGKARLAWSLGGTPPDAAILELGANDGLRGLDPAMMEANLRAILDGFVEREVPVLLAGMAAPRNMGGSYVAEYDAVFPRLAEDYDVVYYPFFLDGVILDPTLNQSDGIHPNEEGVRVIVDRILPYVVDVLARAGEDGSG